MARSAIILAAGFGSRLQADASHKLLTRVGGKTLLTHHLANFARLQVEEVVVVTGFDAETLVAAAREHPSAQGITLRFAFNPSFQGQNGLSVLTGVEALTRADEPFWLTMSDHLFDPALFDDLRQRFDQERYPSWGGALVVDRKLDTIFDMPDATKVRSDPEHFGIGKQLEDFDLVDTGLFWCDKPFVAALEAERLERGDCSTSDAVRRLQAERRYGFWDLGEFLWQDVDTAGALAHASDLLEHHFKGSL